MIVDCHKPFKVFCSHETYDIVLLFRWCIFFKHCALILRILCFHLLLGVSCAVHCRLLEICQRPINTKNLSYAELAYALLNCNFLLLVQNASSDLATILLPSYKLQARKSYFKAAQDEKTPSSTQKLKLYEINTLHWIKRRLLRDIPSVENITDYYSI